ncbi:MAG: ATP-dependent Clp protease proteolytic subunit, partial [Bacteroidota bacterium]
SEAFLGPVDYDHVKQVITDLMQLSQSQEELTLVIQSQGGVTDAGFGLAQFIEQELEGRVTARVWGECSSAATYPLLCCDRRIAHPQATFVLHRQTTGLEIEYTDDFEEKLAQWRRQNEATHQRQIDFYAQKLGLKPKQVEEILQKGMGIDADMTAKQAKELGIITKIVRF